MLLEIYCVGGEIWWCLGVIKKCRCVGEADSCILVVMNRCIFLIRIGRDVLVEGVMCLWDW